MVLWSLMGFHIPLATIRYGYYRITNSYAQVTLLKPSTQAVVPCLHTTGRPSTSSQRNINSIKIMSMKSILSALSKFQDLSGAVVRSSNNPFFKSKYASLEDIQKHIKPHLQKAGLVVTQANVVIDGAPYVESRVWEVSSGEYISSQFPVIVGKVSAQDYGSAVSYAKRYSLSGLLNLIVADEDDDANAASFQGKVLINTGTDSGSTIFQNTAVTTAKPPSTTTSLPSLDAEKYDAMVKFIADGKIKEVESAIKKYTLNDSQKKLLTSLINQAKAEAVTKSAKK